MQDGIWIEKVKEPDVFDVGRASAGEEKLEGGFITDDKLILAVEDLRGFAMDSAGDHMKARCIHISISVFLDFEIPVVGSSREGMVNTERGLNETRVLLILSCGCFVGLETDGFWPNADVAVNHVSHFARQVHEAEVGVGEEDEGMAALEGARGDIVLHSKVSGLTRGGGKGYSRVAY